MLLQFSVKNHRSIKDKAIISMKAAKDDSLKKSLISPDGVKKLVPVMAIYGANAAGKSNVLHALTLMKEMVCGVYAQPLKNEKLPQEPFGFTRETNLPTEFEVIYFYNGIKYAYGYSFNQEHIISEYLYHWPNGREALVFSREEGRYQFRENIQEQMTLAGRTSENRLYLVSSNEWNCVQTEKAYLWFVEKMKNLIGTEMDVQQTLAAVRNSEDTKKRVLREMLIADLGIRDVIVTGSADSPVISTVHYLRDKNGEKAAYSLPLGMESMGTQRFFSRIGLWIEAMETGALLLVDEIESSMHPLLTRHLIEMLQNPESNTKQAQLIFTTHDTGLLDLKLLRRDQIWFVEKDENTLQTEIYALTDFSPRKSENIGKGYLQGRYGAIPFVNGGPLWEG